jgi:tRNA (uracil-5-)-methyltransferase
VPKTIEERIMGLAKMPYDEQLAEKRMTVIRSLRKFHKKYRKATGTKDSPQIEILPTIASPILTGYRNKNEFTIGFDEENKPNVGFVNGNFRNGTVRVDNADECSIVPEIAL